MAVDSCRKPNKRLYSVSVLLSNYFNKSTSRTKSALYKLEMETHTWSWTQIIQLFAQGDGMENNKYIVTWIYIRHNLT